MSDDFGYEGLPVVVTGAASGIGAATARRLLALGADVLGVDVNPPTVSGVRYVRIDLTDPSSIGDGVEQLGPVARLFNCAGLSGLHPAERVMKVNFLGQRRLTEAILATMSDGDAIVSIASLAGAGYEQNRAVVDEVLAIADFDDAWKWCVEHPEHTEAAYTFSKQCVIVYTQRECIGTAARGIRVNCTAPGPVDTPLLEDSKRVLGERAVAEIPRPLGRNSLPEEQAEVLVWLNSTLASYVNGAVIWTDGGFTSGRAAGRS